MAIGQDRAGFYSNTWLENLTGANIHNADAIHPGWQRRTIGGRVLLARRDLMGGFLAHMAQTRIVALQPKRLIADIPCRFVLQPIDGQTTRLLLRESVSSTLAGRAVNTLMWDPMHFVMEQRMLRGIKERAEGQPLVPTEMMLVSRVGWILAGASLLRLFLARRRWRPWVCNDRLGQLVEQLHDARRYVDESQQRLATSHTNRLVVSQPLSLRERLRRLLKAAETCRKRLGQES